MPGASPLLARRRAADAPPLRAARVVDGTPPLRDCLDDLDALLPDAPILDAPILVAPPDAPPPDARAACTRGRHNACERRRVQNMNGAFERLCRAARLPPGTQKRLILEHAALLLELVPGDALDVMGDDAEGAG